MTDLIKGLNPFEGAKSEEAALAKARASSIALVISVIWMIVNQVASAPIMKQAVDMGVPGLTEATLQIGLMVSIGMIVIHIGLAVLQWFKPNGVIPIIFAVLSGLAAAMGLLGAVTPSPIEVPMWLLYLAFAMPVITLLIHISGWRGASALARYRGEE